LRHIGFISDSPGERTDAVRQALEELEASGDFSLNSAFDIHGIDSIARRVWAALNLSDVVVAHVGKCGPNVLYEIGLAHGLGKPVVIVSDDPLGLPADLADQRVIQLERGSYSQENFVFRLRQAIEHVERKRADQSDYWGPRSRTDNATRDGSTAPKTFRALFTEVPNVRHAQFARWFRDMACLIPGWELIEPAGRLKADEGFDFVVWNNRSDHSLAALGNPVAVEAKSTRSFNSSSLKSLAGRVENAGLRAVLLVTSGTNDPASYRRVAGMLEEHNVLMVALDKSDFLTIGSPDGLLEAIRARTSKALYGVGR